VGLVAGTAAAVALVYGCIILAAHLTSVGAVWQWIDRSRYDKLPNRGVLRMLVSIPRGFYSLGQGTTEWKRMFFEHRHLSLVDLLLTGIWKVGLVYVALAVSAVALWRSSWGRRHLVCLLVTALPVCIFAAFVFEATPPERYMAVFPLLFLGFAWILADRRSGGFAWIALPLFFASTLATNLTALSRFREPAEFGAARARLQALNDRVGPNDCIVVQSYQDEALRFMSARPFSPLSKNRFLYDVAVPWGTAHPELWRRQLAALVETSWRNGGHAWVSRRFLAAVPDPQWGWVEQDDVRLRWVDFHAFFEQLDLGDPFGGADGFSEIARTPRNQLLFDATASPGR
jgi:hypothetical protein